MRAARITEVHIADQTITSKTADGATLTTVRVDDPALLDTLESANVDVHGVEESADGVGTILGWILPLVIMAGLWWWMLRKMRSGMGGSSGLFSFGKRKARVMEGEQTGVSFDDVGGLGEALTDLREVTDFPRDPDHFQRLGGKMPKGVLLVGPPGTGNYVKQSLMQKAQVQVREATLRG